MDELSCTLCNYLHDHYTMTRSHNSEIKFVYYKYYLREVITTMMKHINQIDFEKNDKGTITGYKGHSISDDILDSFAPWNLAKKFDDKNE